MTSLLAFAATVNSFGMPVIGIVVLLASKLCSSGKRVAERFFMAVLTLVTLITMHTVTTHDPAWLTHTLTLALMIVGAVWMPCMREPEGDLT